MQISIYLGLDADLRTILILASTFLLIQEFQSSHLIVWPVDHSCRVQNDLSKDEYILDLGNNRSFTAQVVQFSLFDVAQEESAAVAKAISEGIHYEDIAHCYQHPVETDSLGQTTINKDNVESCRDGLHFEEHGNNLSVVAHFQLACDRQWLRVLLPQSMGLGFLLGTLDAYVSSRLLFLSSLSWPYAYLGQLINNVRGVDGKDGFYKWLFLQALGLILIHAIHHVLTESYTYILSSSLLRSVIVGLCLERVMFNWTTDKLPATSGGSLPTKSLAYLEKNQFCFVATTLMYTFFQAFYDPLALRLVKNWIQLNKWLNIEVTVLSILTTFSYLLCKPATSWTTLESSGRSSISNYEPASTMESPFEEEDNNSPVQIHQNRFNRLRLESTKLPYMKLCEFCLINQEPLHAITIIHQNGRQQQSDEICGQISWNDSSARDTIDDFSTYQPTTVPNFALNGGCWLRDTNGGRLHNFGFFYQNLLTKSVMIQLWLLSFCVCLNYFFLRFLPNHAMLHSETLASRLARKIQYRQTHPLSSEIITASSTPETSGNDTSHRSLLQDHFDYSSINYGTHAIELMKNSSNPFQVLAITLDVNGWLIELAIILLHTANLSRFSISYFKLKRLLTLVQFGTQVLVVEWILLGLMRRQNHLIEWDWMYWIALVIARFGATLLLFNYFFTALKMSQILRTDQLIRFLPSVIAIVLALLLASLAPILEKFDLVVIPVSLAINNALAYLISRSLDNQLRQSLCPMLFYGDEPNSP